MNTYLFERAKGLRYLLPGQWRYETFSPAFSRNVEYEFWSMTVIMHKFLMRKCLSNPSRSDAKRYLHPLMTLEANCQKIWALLHVTYMKLTYLTFKPVKSVELCEQITDPATYNPTLKLRIFWKLQMRIWPKKSTEPERWCERSQKTLGSSQNPD